MFTKSGGSVEAKGRPCDGARFQSSLKVSPDPPLMTARGLGLEARDQLSRMAQIAPKDLLTMHK